ncbi:hypothetical protein [Streptomyces carpaticus]|uniref:Uncharacterized protein n=1 Tax=Streptomyces carpaticus TaxID=285558 RepID=A0ABV4ZGR5_9ACTN
MLPIGAGLQNERLMPPIEKVHTESAAPAVPARISRGWQDEYALWRDQKPPPQSA